MTKPEWSKKHFNTGKPFMRICDGRRININDEKGRPRFWNEIFKFGDISVIVSKEWYDRQQGAFTNWYITV